MRAVKICLILISFGTIINAQSIGQWKIYSDMKKINDAVATSTGIWAATDGAAFKFNFSDSSYTIVNKVDGLNSQALTSVTVDNDSKIWFGSQEGYINVFNTRDNSVSKIVDIFTSGKTQKQINRIFVKGDSVFVSFDFGLAIINAKTLSFIDSFLKLGSFPAESKIISAFKSSLIYAVTEYGVAVQKPGTTNLTAPESWNTFPLSSFLPQSTTTPSATQILEYNGQILLATSNGIYSFNNISWQLFAFEGKNIINMSVFGSSLYAISANQVLRYSGGQSSVVYTNGNVTFNSIAVSGSQIFYISTSQGLIEYKNNITRIRYPNGPAGNLFVNLSVDPIGTLWVATGKNNAGKGFFGFDGSNWKVYDKSIYPILPSNDYYNVYAAPDSAIYLANWGNGITILKKNTLQVFTANNSSLIGIPSDNKFVAITDCKTDSKGNLWILNTQSASRKPLSVYTKQNQWVHFSFSSPPLSESDNLDKLSIDQYDTKWFTVTINGRFGLYFFNENKTLDNTNDDIQGYLNSSNNLLSDLITALAIDARGYLWIGTNIGLNVIVGVDVRTDPTKVKVTSNLGVAVRNQTVTCIAIDPLDQKWIGTKQGVFVLSSDGIQLINQYNTKNSPLPSDDIKSIAFDAKNGIAYIGTDYGLAALQTASIQPLQSFSELFVYPNPFVLSNDAASLTIDGLIKNSSIRIFNINGNLIRDFKSPGGKIAFWDGKDLEGNLVPTGVYIIVAYDDEANNVKTSKVAVIKK
jgi:ligand-binding sensor domain-containing protein